MNKIKIAAAFAIVLAAPAYAQTSANSLAQTQAQSSAANQGNNQAVTFEAAHVPSTTTVRTAPALGGNSFYGSFSTDNCMVSAGGGFSVIGAGGQVVTPVRDDQCAVLRGVERTMQVAASVSRTEPKVAGKLQQGAIDMLCALNPTVGAALQAQGVCSKPQKTVAAIPTPAQTSEQERTRAEMARKCPACMR